MFLHFSSYVQETGDKERRSSATSFPHFPSGVAIIRQHGEGGASGRMEEGIIQSLIASYFDSDISAK